MNIKRNWQIIIFSFGIIITYYCMSIWGMGTRNPVKYFLYLPVLVFSFLLVRTWRKRKNTNRANFSASPGFLASATLILATATAGLFLQYEMYVFYNEMQINSKRIKGVITERVRVGKKKEIYNVFVYSDGEKKYRNRFYDPARKWKIGDTITVLYTPKYPYNSVAEVEYE
jgi:hypothetical protein